MIWKRREIQCETLEEFNRHMKLAKEICFKVFYEKYDRQSIRQNAYFEETPKYFKLTYRLFKDKRTYVFERNGEYNVISDTKEIAAEFAKVHKVQELSDYMPYEKDPKMGYRACIGAASPIRDSNKKYRNKATENCYEYDMSHAYGQFLRESLPDLSTVRYDAVVEDGQVGFDWLGSTMKGLPKLVMCEKKGIRCRWVFDLMDSPYKDKVDRIIAQLNKETDERKRANLKNKFRYFVGWLQNHNPFWRAYVVEKCNITIRSFLDEDSVYWSTDSIVSARRRPDIMASGYEWKVKNQGTFKLKERTSYQWNDCLPKVNGAKKLYIKGYNMTHEKKFDLLKDEAPVVCSSAYVFDGRAFEIIKNPEIEEYE